MYAAKAITALILALVALGVGSAPWDDRTALSLGAYAVSAGLLLIAERLRP